MFKKEIKHVPKFDRQGKYNLVYIITYYCCTIGFPELAGTIAVFSKEGGAGLVDRIHFIIFTCSLSNNEWIVSYQYKNTHYTVELIDIMLFCITILYLKFEITVLFSYSVTDSRF